MDQANAFPRKRFFIEMFTRDISLSDCILDLVDNSIDGLIRANNIDLGESLVSPQLSVVPKNLPLIKINFSSNQFSISDNCGGIDFKLAQSEIFNFGHEDSYHDNKSDIKLGVYGIGMKRAIFKIGDYFKIESKSLIDGFITEVSSLKEWVKQDSKIEDWKFPISRIEKAPDFEKTGTTITIKKLREEAIYVLNDATFLKKLIQEVAKAYALFLNKYVRIKVNELDVDPVPIPFGKSEEVIPAYKKLQYNGVQVNLFASVASRSEKGDWKIESAGWYIACNGRLVLTSNKDELTGWGAGPLPQFVPKYRGFVGLAIFQSHDPYSLPWTTTKRGLNRESQIYQKTKTEMQKISRPILTFLNNMYQGEIPEDATHRDIAEKIKDTNISELVSATETSFTINSKKLDKQKRTTTRIQYSVQNIDIEKIKKHLSNPKISNGDIGLLTFKEYLKQANL